MSELIFIDGDFPVPGAECSYYCSPTCHPAQVGPEWRYGCLHPAWPANRYGAFCPIVYCKGHRANCQLLQVLGLRRSALLMDILLEWKWKLHQELGPRYRSRFTTPRGEKPYPRRRIILGVRILRVEKKAAHGVPWYCQHRIPVKDLPTTEPEMRWLLESCLRPVTVVEGMDVFEFSKMPDSSMQPGFIATKVHKE